MVVTGKLEAGYDPICDPPGIPEIPETDIDPTPPPNPCVAQLQTRREVLVRVSHVTEARPVNSPDEAPSMTAW